MMEELGQVWRVHRKPRKGLFAPEDPSCPVEVKKLTARRTTEVRYDDGTIEVRVDDLGKGFDHQSLGRTWTGITKLELQASVALTPRWQTKMRSMTPTSARKW